MNRHPRSPRMLSIEELTTTIQAGEIDTVIVAFTDMQGRLQGKYLHGQYFLEHAQTHGVEGCSYLLAVDVEMNTVAGYDSASWETGYGDMAFDLDLDTIRYVPWLERTVMIQCDLRSHHGELMPISPRSMLRRQLERVEARGWRALAGTELEFLIYDTSYEEAWASDYRNLTPSNQYNVDYSVLGSARVEPLLRQIRNQMHTAGMTVESAKGECNFGQHEIGFLYADALTTADNHAVYKTGAKTIAAQHGKSITFMAKPNDRDGSSCHIHLSLRGQDGADGETVFWQDGGRTALYDHFIAGVLATMSDFTLFYAPNINSYKRFVESSFAPTAVAWGVDNRTCSVRLVGQGAAARLENRLPGADTNPYLALAATLAGGLYGIENELPLEAATEGNAYTSGAPQVPKTLREARDVFASSEVVRQALGQEVVDHYVNFADVELAAFEAAVTDWELRRGFERL